MRPRRHMLVHLTRSRPERRKGLKELQTELLAQSENLMRYSDLCDELDEVLNTVQLLEVAPILRKAKRLLGKTYFQMFFNSKNGVRIDEISDSRSNQYRSLLVLEKKFLDSPWAQLPDRNPSGTLERGITGKELKLRKKAVKRLEKLASVEKVAVAGNILKEITPWTLIHEEPPHLFWYRPIKEGGGHAMEFLITTKLDCPLAPLGYLALDVDSFPMWMPMVGFSNRKCKEDYVFNPPLSRVFHHQFQSPFPRLFAHRDVYMRMQLIDNLTPEKSIIPVPCVLMYGESFRNDPILVRERKLTTVTGNDDDCPHRHAHHVVGAKPNVQKMERQISSNITTTLAPQLPKKTKRIDLKTFQVKAIPHRDAEGRTTCSVEVFIQIDPFMSVPMIVMKTMIGSLFVQSLHLIQRYAVAIQKELDGETGDWEHASHFAKQISKDKEYQRLLISLERYLKEL